MSIIKGIKFPLQFKGGSVVTSTDDTHIEESVIQIIGIAKGEYLLKPDIGSRLSERIFDPVNLAALVGIDIRDAIRKYEPRIRLVDTNINLEKSNLGVVNIVVGYIIKGRTEITNTSFSLGS